MSICPSHVKVQFSCVFCDVLVVRRLDYVTKRRAMGKPDSCTSCSNREAAKLKWASYTEEVKEHIFHQFREGGVLYWQNCTTEERQERSRHAGSCNTSYSVQRQWESIKNNPQAFASLKKQRGQTHKKIWASYNTEQRNARVKKALGDRKVSKSGTDFLNCVRDLGFHIEEEVPISGFVVDGLHKETNTIFLYHGDFWHCNPKTYTNPDQYCSWIKRTVGQQWLRDNRALGAFYAMGYQVIVVWESSWVQNKMVELDRILSILTKGSTV